MSAVSASALEPAPAASSSAFNETTIEPVDPPKNSRPSARVEEDKPGPGVPESNGAGGLALGGLSASGRGRRASGISAPSDGGLGWGTYRSSSSLVFGPVEVAGALPPEIVQRILRMKIGTFRGCYDDALRRKPRLAGAVKVVFAIDPNGSVTNVRDAGSTLGDSTAVACVLHGHESLRFAERDTGEVTVTSTIKFAPP